MTYNLNIFISHSWQHPDHYETLRTWIFNNHWKIGDVDLNFNNYSVPRDDPIHNAPNAQMLQNAIDALIISSHIVIIPTGMYSSYSEWIDKELQSAQKHDKPILGVRPRGQQKNSGVVQENADKTVGWKEKSVLNGIVELSLR